MSNAIQIKHRNGYVGTYANCCKDAKEQPIYWSHNQWVFDCDNGYRGPTVNYCPFCGQKLLTPDSSLLTLFSQDELDALSDLIQGKKPAPKA